MLILKLILEAFGLVWIIMTLMISILGGSIKIVIRNPLTKKNEIISNINIIK